MEDEFDNAPGIPDSVNKSAGNIMGENVNNPWVKPEVEIPNTEADTLRSQTNPRVNQVQSEQASGIYGLRNEMYATPKTALDPMANNNFSKNSRYGNLNEKSYQDTLRLSRQADAYNNRPVDTMMLGGSAATGTGSYSLGQETQKYSRPQIETQEMRQMRANERLDEAQRGTDVRLQAALNSKNYDVFKDAYQRIANSLDTRAQQRYALEAFDYAERYRNFFAKNYDVFKAELEEWLSGDKITRVWNQFRSNPLFAMMMSMAIVGQPMPDMGSIVQWNLYQQLMNAGVSPEDATRMIYGLGLRMVER